MDANNYQQVAWSCMNKYVGVTTTDGQSHDGFIAHVDQDFVTLAIPTNEMFQGMPAQNSTYRQFGFHQAFSPDAALSRDGFLLVPSLHCFYSRFLFNDRREAIPPPFSYAITSK